MQLTYLPILGALAIGCGEAALSDTAPRARGQALAAAHEETLKSEDSADTPAEEAKQTDPPPLSDQLGNSEVSEELCLQAPEDLTADCGPERCVPASPLTFDETTTSIGSFEIAFAGVAARSGAAQISARALSPRTDPRSVMDPLATLEIDLGEGWNGRVDAQSLNEAMAGGRIAHYTVIYAVFQGEPLFVAGETYTFSPGDILSASVEAAHVEVTVRATLESIHALDPRVCVLPADETAEAAQRVVSFALPLLSPAGFENPVDDGESEREPCRQICLPISASQRERCLPEKCVAASPLRLNRHTTEADAAAFNAYEPDPGPIMFGVGGTIAGGNDDIVGNERDFLFQMELDDAWNGQFDPQSLNAAVTRGLLHIETAVYRNGFDTSYYDSDYYAVSPGDIVEATLCGNHVHLSVNAAWLSGSEYINESCSYQAPAAGGPSRTIEVDFPVYFGKRCLVAAPDSGEGCYPYICSVATEIWLLDQNGARQRVLERVEQSESKYITLRTAWAADSAAGPEDGEVELVLRRSWGGSFDVDTLNRALVRGTVFTYDQNYFTYARELAGRLAYAEYSVAPGDIVAASFDGGSVELRLNAQLETARSAAAGECTGAPCTCTWNEPWIELPSFPAQIVLRAGYDEPPASANSRRSRGAQHRFQ